MKTYRIKTEIQKFPWGATWKYLKKMWISRSAFHKMLKELKARDSTKEKYTRFFNEIFKKSLTKEYLFEIIEFESI